MSSSEIFERESFYRTKQGYSKKKDQGPHDRNFLAPTIINENFLRGATERNTHQRQEVIFARTSKALKARYRVSEKKFSREYEG